MIDSDPQKTTLIALLQTKLTHSLLTTTRRPVSIPPARGERRALTLSNPPACVAGRLLLHYWQRSADDRPNQNRPRTPTFFRALRGGSEHLALSVVAHATNFRLAHQV